MTAVGPSPPPPRWSSVAVSKRPSAGWTPKRVEEGAADEQAVDGIGLAAGRQVEAIVGPRDRAIEERRGPALDLFPDRVGPAAVDHDERFGVAHRQRAQQHRVDQREDRGVGADAQAERQRRRHDEAGPLQQAADAVAHVLRDVVCPAGAAHVAAGFLHLLDAADLERGQAPRLAFADARVDERADAALDVILQLAIEVAIERRSTTPAVPPAHDASSAFS